MKIILSKTFLKSIKKIDTNIQDIIIEKISLLEIMQENLDIKKLNPKKIWIYRLRIGKYRVLFKYFDKDIKLLDIDNRDSIYK